MICRRTLDVGGPACLALVFVLLAQEAPLPQSTWMQQAKSLRLHHSTPTTRIPNQLPAGHLLVDRENSVDGPEPADVPDHHAPAPFPLPEKPQLSYEDKETVAGSAAKRSFVEEISAIAVAVLAAVAGGVTAAVRGTGKPAPQTEVVAVQEVENYGALNLLWYVLTAGLIAIAVVLGREFYLGDLRPFILHDMLVSVVAVVSGVIWVRMFRTLASEGFIERKLSRKLIHITSAPLFLLCWPLYTNAPTARCVAAIPPLANAIRLLNAGLGKVENQDAVQAISRQGGRNELLQGPLYYVLVLLTATTLGWRSSIASYISICLMAGGDGLADIVGRRFGKVKLPWNKNKSWAGSLAMVLGGFLMSTAFVFAFGYAGFLPTISPDQFLLRLGAVCLLTTVVESLPTTQWWPLDDNVSVPLFAMVLSALFFHTV